jgi:hypothetical protein
VGSADGIGGVEVGNRECHFQDAVVGAGLTSDRVKSFSTESSAGGHLFKGQSAVEKQESSATA